MPKKNQHILVLRFSSLGDVAMIVPVLSALKQSHPDCQLTVLTKPQFVALFSHLEQVTAIAVDLEKDYKGLLGLYRLSKFIKSLNVNIVADLHNVLRTKILKVFLPTTTWHKLDKGRSEKKQLTSGQIFSPLKPTVERYADVFRALGYNLSLTPPVFYKPKKLSQNPHNFLKSLTGPIIGVAPFAAYESKTYPLDKMKNVIEKISRHNTVLLFGGGLREQKLLESISQRSAKVYSASGKFTLAEELMLMSRLKGMLAMDSGNAHLAAMMGVPVITLWGVTHPYAGFTPFNQPLKNCLLADRSKYPKIPTSIYGNRFPDGYEKAIETIEEKDIIKAIDNL